MWFWNLAGDFLSLLSQGKTCRNSLGGRRISLWLSMVLKSEDLLLSWFKSLHFQCNSCGVLCGLGSLQWHLFEDLLPKFPWILTMSYWGSLGYVSYFSFRAFLICTGLLHSPLWSQCSFYTSCFEQALGHPQCKVGGWFCVWAPALGSGELLRWTSSSLYAELPRAFQILKILDIPWQKKLGRIRGKVMVPMPGSPPGGQLGARWNRGAGGKHKVIPVLFVLSNQLGFKCQAPDPLLPLCAHGPLFATSLRSEFVVRGNWRDQSSKTQNIPVPRRDSKCKTTLWLADRLGRRDLD